MELAWRHGRLTVKQALFRLGYSRRPAYTTVQTVLTRLCGKGLLTKKKSGRAYEYVPTLTLDDFLKQRLDEIASCLRRNFDQT